MTHSTHIPPVARQLLYRYGFSLLLLGAAHAFVAGTWQYIGVANATVFLAAVVLSSLQGGYGPGLLVTVLASIDLAYVFMPPYHSFVLRFEDLLFLVIFATLALLTSSLHGRRRSADQQLREAHAKLERDLVNMSEREQQRIGNDLHDGLGQELAGIAMLTAALKNKLSSETNAQIYQTADAIDAQRIADLVQESIQHTRDLARALCPVELKDNELASALEQLVSRLNRLPNLLCHLEIQGISTVHAQTAIQLYRIVQEAVTNAIRHGRAKSIWIVLASTPAHLRMTVRDNGVGLGSMSRPDGMGLQLMRSRARMIGGSLKVHSPPDGGTVLELNAPQAGMT